MIRGLSGNFLPQSEADFSELQLSRGLRFNTCCDCHKMFSSANIKTPAGWQETQITGLCETCFDGLFEEAEE
jgi:hypothetical protein